MDLTDGSQPFGDLLRRHRVLAGMSQEELAERASLSARAISDLERGVKRTPRRDTVQLLVEALELSGDARTAFVTAAREPAGCDPDDACAAAGRGISRGGARGFPDRARGGVLRDSGRDRGCHTGLRTATGGCGGARCG